MVTLTQDGADHVNGGGTLPPVDVTVRDAGGLSDQDTVSIGSGDSTAPTVTADQSYSYAENQTAGAVVVTATATDNVAVTGWQFANGTQTTTDGYYQINNSGQISITAAGVVAGVANNDYETTPNSFTLSVQAKDAAGNWSAATDVTLNVTNVNEAPSLGFGNTTGTIEAGSATAGQAITTAQGTDPDAGDMLSYALTPNSTAATSG